MRYHDMSPDERRECNRLAIERRRAKLADMSPDERASYWQGVNEGQRRRYAARNEPKPAKTPPVLRLTAQQAYRVEQLGDLVALAVEAGLPWTPLRRVERALMDADGKTVVLAASDMRALRAVLRVLAATREDCYRVARMLCL